MYNEGRDRLTIKTRTTKMTAETKTYGDLMDYATGDYIRPATQAEREASDAEVAMGHAEGVIEVEGRSCYVEA